MMMDAPPVIVQDQTADDFKPMEVFKTESEAREFIKTNGGLLVKDQLEPRFFVIRIPNKEKK